MNKPLHTSMRMAFALGIILPLAETIRRIHEVLAFENILHWLDDYILETVLLCAAYATREQKQNSPQYLIVAWGMAAGALALSLLGQLDGYLNHTVDAGIFSSGLVLCAKAAILAFIIFGLQQSIKATNYKTT